MRGGQYTESQYTERVSKLEVVLFPLCRYDKLRENFKQVRTNETRLRQQLEDKVSELKTSHNQFEVSI